MESIFSGGDFRYFWPENISNFIQIPTSWDSILNTGIGKVSLPSLWINSYLNFTAIFTKLGLDWNLVGLFFWIFPAVLLSFFGAFILFLRFFPDKKLYGLLSGIIYLGNTYFLMVSTGGQLGIALAYSLAPLVLFFFLRCLDNLNLNNSLAFGLILSLQVLFDPRIVYVTAATLFLFWIFSIPKKNIKKYLKKSLLLGFSLPLLTVFLLHSFWILPTIFFHQNPIEQFGSEFKSIEAVKFFSFANLENSVSLLHPNFPENIFGKTYFLRPEFLLLPILAFSSLLFIKNRFILFFASIGLIGVFLAKGANDPFGGVYIWMFNHIPGFVMFRDPTKWYTLIAISYSILIPFSIFSIEERLKSKIKNQKSKIQSKYQIFNFSYVFLIFTIFYLLFLIYPIKAVGVLEKLKPKLVPSDYVLLKDFLNNQPGFFRTIWIPQWQRFGYFSNTHPAIGREEVLKGNAREQVKTLREFGSEQKLKDLGIKYVIVPYDSEEEIFLDDRKYDEKQYKETVGTLQKFPWLSEIDGFSRIRVFEVNDPNEHFWCNCGANINYQFIKPTKYRLTVQNAKKGDILVFSESFDKNWVAGDLASQGNPLHAQKFENNLNGFTIPENGDFEFLVSYEPQKWVNIGLLIGFLTLSSVSLFLILGVRGKKW